MHVHNAVALSQTFAESVPTQSSLDDVSFEDLHRSDELNPQGIHIRYEMSPSNREFGQVGVPDVALGRVLRPRRGLGEIPARPVAFAVTEGRIIAMDVKFWGSVHECCERTALEMQFALVVRCNEKPHRDQAVLFHCAS